MSKKTSPEDQESKLISIVADQSSSIQSSKVTYSVRELNSMYKEEELDIKPDFQRAYRWSEKQKSSLIESILLDIPLPSIFVAQNEDNSLSVVDGVQRLSTILSFMGAFESSKSNGYEAFKLQELEYLPELNGLGWDELPNALQRKIKQCGVDITNLSSSSSADARFKLFLRLNAGSVLTSQELRNCLLVMANVEMFETVKALSGYKSFLEVAQISKKKREEAFLDELVLRFFFQISYKDGRSSLKKDFGEHLTQWLNDAAVEKCYLDQDKVKLFKQTFDVILAAGGRDSFKKYSSKENRRYGGFSNAAFELVCTGVARNIEYWQNNKEELSAKLKEFWDYPDFAENTGQGINARDRFPVLVNAGTEYFSE